MPNYVLDWPRRLLNRLASDKPPLTAAMRNSGWLLLDKLLRTLAGVAVGIAIARSLGPTEFGRLSFAMSFVALFAPVAGLGLDAIVVRTLITEVDSDRKTDASGQVLGSSCALKSASSIIACLVCIGTAVLLSNEQGSLSLILVLSLGLLTHPMETADLWFQSQVASKHTVLAKLPAFIIGNLSRVFCIASAAGALAFAWIQSLELLLGALALVMTYQIQRRNAPHWRLDTDRMRRLLAEAWPVVLAGISVMLYMKIDVVMLEHIQGNQQTGVYSAATRISEGLYFIPMVIASSLLPMLTRARFEGPNKYATAFHYYYLHSIRISMVIATIIYLSAPWIIPLLFGTDYNESVAVLKIHVWALIGVALGVASAQHLNIERKQTVALLRTTTGLIANVLLNILLIPRYSATGAALATLISYSIATLLPVCIRQLRPHMWIMLKTFHPAVLIGLRKP